MMQNMVEPILSYHGSRSNLRLVLHFIPLFQRVGVGHDSIKCSDKLKESVMLRIPSLFLISFISLPVGANIINLNCGKNSLIIDTNNTSAIKFNGNSAILIRAFINESSSKDYQINGSDSFLTLTESFSGDYSINIQSPDMKSRVVMSCSKS